ncbi:MAG: hypothetical protein CMJ32_06135 [Phycisphaerae bacterium]|nr:hypothetical protein [Phycisphaerae bacterium]
MKFDMTKKVLWIAWALIPVLFIAWYFGPGQDSLGRYQAGQSIRQATAAAGDLQWQEAVDAYTEALEQLSDSDEQLRQYVELERANAIIQNGEIWKGISQLDTIVEECGQSDPELARAARSSVGMARYYAAWLMRLEGATPEEWKPETEIARQHFKLLASMESDPTASDAFRKNVESVIRLEQMDLSELKMLPLPGNCPNCKNCKDTRPGNCKNGQCKGDGRQKINKSGAGAARKNGAGS